MTPVEWAIFSRRAIYTAQGWQDPVYQVFEFYVRPFLSFGLFASRFVDPAFPKAGSIRLS
jgi:hypothetical protein